jgi:hypothetical protein
MLLRLHSLPHFEVSSIIFNLLETVIEDKKTVLLLGNLFQFLFVVFFAGLK